MVLMVVPVQCDHDHDPKLIQHQHASLLVPHMFDASVLLSHGIDDEHLQHHYINHIIPLIYRDIDEIVIMHVKYRPRSRTSRAVRRANRVSSLTY